ncbi:hypothetical protein BU25DRAFT_439277 [Macroventuria anomochaeta]|uniref:Uncharacterized protein n=1 Tax=Macroventuria anomochaeta TaxID=301207 RepID=A0ACB6S3G8_9PLEO|nr:uncharacterized protein BU25DRAFT_439277 [Macroventuria anomochaeta]KAF2628785.1 hypothetical protein BU25DRAFT_439277 [Macroventuria anomochaeta]
MGRQNHRLHQPPLLLGSPRTHRDQRTRPARGLVPAIEFNNQILTEPGVVARFFADAYTSHLVPATGTADAALVRERINSFEELVKEILDKVGKEIEPLLKDAPPLFGGSSKVTLAEALTAPFNLRVYSFSKNGLLPKSVVEGFERLPKFDKWAKKVIQEESVTYVWNEAEVIPATKKKIENLKAAAR